MNTKSDNQNQEFKAQETAENQEAKIPTTIHGSLYAISKSYGLNGNESDKEKLITSIKDRYKEIKTNAQDEVDQIKSSLDTIKDLYVSLEDEINKKIKNIETTQKNTINNVIELTSILKKLDDEKKFKDKIDSTIGDLLNMFDAIISSIKTTNENTIESSNEILQEKLKINNSILASYKDFLNTLNGELLELEQVEIGFNTGNSIKLALDALRNKENQ
ncbi:hypothetical protein GCM10028807_36340 [Spirosoma daeguense]